MKNVNLVMAGPAEPRQNKIRVAVRELQTADDVREAPRELKKTVGGSSCEHEKQRTVREGPIMRIRIRAG